MPEIFLVKSTILQANVIIRLLGLKIQSAPMQRLSFVELLKFRDYTNIKLYIKFRVNRFSSSIATWISSPEQLLFTVENN